MTWILFVSVWAGNATYQYAIPNLASYRECVRISEQVPRAPWSTVPEFKCVETPKPPVL